VCGDVGYSQQTQECLFVQSFLGDRLAQATCHPSLLSKELPVRPGSIIFTKSGGMHGIRNAGVAPLRFVAFLYHSS
jgi:oxalate decarboxylase/phosphoglucose isomerase-like protein (cupin superfamily)